MTTQYRTREGDTADLICWRHYGRQAGAVEQLLAANPGLAGEGALLQSGLVIVLPAIADPPAVTVVRLWS